MQLLRWSYPFYGRVLRDKDSKSRNINPTKCSLQEITGEVRKIPRKGIWSLEDSDDEDSDEGHLGKKFCQYHGTCGHTVDQCITLKALVKQAKQKKSKHFDKKKRFTKYEVNDMLQKHVEKALKQKKKEVY